MQWAARLIAVPIGKTNLERTLARERRKAVADGYMLPLMGVLFWTLLLAIGFFVLGFLIQLWALSVSFDGPAPILLIGGALATGLSLIIVGIIVASTVHASLHENSPFESPLSNAMRPMLQRIRRHFKTGSPEAQETHGTQEVDRLDNASIEGGIEDVTALIKWNDSDSTDEKALKTYARLVIDTSDTEVLERAVPSFDLEAWHDHASALTPVFHAVRRRFLSTDTSFRVKETIYHQLVPSQNWNSWTVEWHGERAWKDDLGPNALTRWCKGHYERLVGRSRESHRRFFIPWLFFTSLEKGNRDLRGTRLERYEECLGRILRSCHRGSLEVDRSKIFRSAIAECDLLLRDGKADVVARILSHLTRPALWQAFMLNRGTGWYRIEPLVSFITKGLEVEVLDEISYFISNLSDFILVNDELILQFLFHLKLRLPPNFIIPAHLDLARLLDRVAKRKFVKSYGDTMIYYLNHGGLEKLSDLHPASAFLEACLSLSREPLWWLNMETTPTMKAFERQYHACFVPLPSLSDEECEDLSSIISGLIWNEPSNRIRSVQEYKRPILELLDLTSEQREDVITRVLDRVDRSDLIALLMKDSHLEWIRIEPSVTFIARDPRDILASLSTFIGERSFLRRQVTCILVLECLAEIQSRLPETFTLPEGFDVTRMIEMLVDFRYNIHDWFQHSHTVMVYLDYGAFANIDNLEAAAEFFDLFIEPDLLDLRDRACQYHKRDRAAFYLEEVNKRRATRMAMAGSDDSSSDTDALLAEDMNRSRSNLDDEVVAPVAHRRWWNLLRLAWNRRRNRPQTSVLPRGPDLELGPVSPPHVPETDAEVEVPWHEQLL
ncbi:hypothetical protein SISSUDRAFT_242511 [Sistotremastrum suecicum HHB10207 ss-3]|uniref:Uncharacterized protein n=1 Tax=Sistotremastrum suecicum HHB10207 ss-3 TaxID=1314776 RepID=A0A165ZZS7_9AGAM|nr:hypothetical protein SISSUDRAFT_242511 [Sistotremastrum suecicum HHB10207 ss-3]